MARPVRRQVSRMLLGASNAARIAANRLQQHAIGRLIQRTCSDSELRISGARRGIRTPTACLEGTRAAVTPASLDARSIAILVSGRPRAAPRELFGLVAGWRGCLLAP